MSQVASPPSSPRDHRHYIPRRPSPLSLPPTAPHLGLAASSSTYQPFSLTALAVETPRTGSKMPRYPLEKQRRALKELEMEHQQRRQTQQMQRQDPMYLPQKNHQQAPVQDIPSPTTTLPLTPRSAASSVSSYSQNEDEAQKNKARNSRAPLSICTSVFGPCLAAFAVSSRRIENINMRTIASPR